MLQANASCDLTMYQDFYEEDGFGAELITIANAEFKKKGYRIGNVTSDIMKADFGVQLMIGMEDGKVWGAEGFIRIEDEIINTKKDPSILRSMFGDFNKTVRLSYKRISKALAKKIPPCGE